MNTGHFFHHPLESDLNTLRRFIFTNKQFHRGTEQYLLRRVSDHLEKYLSGHCKDFEYFKHLLTLTHKFRGLTYSRQCIECHKRVFHAVAYEYEWILRCPVHDIALSTKCPYCCNFYSYFREGNRCDHCRLEIQSVAFEDRRRFNEQISTKLPSYNSLILEVVKAARCQKISTPSGVFYSALHSPHSINGATIYLANDILSSSSNLLRDNIYYRPKEINIIHVGQLSELQEPDIDPLIDSYSRFNKFKDIKIRVFQKYVEFINKLFQSHVFCFIEYSSCPFCETAFRFYQAFFRDRYIKDTTYYIGEYRAEIFQAGKIELNRKNYELSEPVNRLLYEYELWRYINWTLTTQLIKIQDSNYKESIYSEYNKSFNNLAPTLIGLRELNEGDIEVVISEVDFYVLLSEISQSLLEKIFHKSLICNKTHSEQSEIYTLKNFHNVPVLCSPLEDPDYDLDIFQYCEQKFDNKNAKFHHLLRLQESLKGK